MIIEWHHIRGVPSKNYIGRQLGVSYIGRQEFSMRHLAANISSPKVRELDDQYLLKERAQACS